MPYLIKVDPENRVVISRIAGVLDYTVASAHMDQLLADSSFQPGFSQLIDFRGVAEVALTADEVRGLAQRTVFGPHSKRAFLVSTDLQFGFSRLFASHRDMLGEGYIGVFKTVVEAVAWIGGDVILIEKSLANLSASCDFD
jgi:hypothetical protein